MVRRAPQSHECALARHLWRVLQADRVARTPGYVVFDVPEANKCSFRRSVATDNKGNSHVVSRLLTTKFPLNAFLMELAIQLQRRGAELHLFWLPRLQNVEADAWTNNDTARFDPFWRVRLDVSSFKGVLLREYALGCVFIQRCAVA